MVIDLELAWFLGAAGLLIGAPVGFVLGRGRVGLTVSIVVAVGVGVVAGIGVDLILIHDVLSSDSSTAAVGLIALPIPLILNPAGALLSALPVRGLALPAPPVPSVQTFDLTTGRPDSGYDGQTDRPILGTDRIRVAGCALLSP